MRKYLSHLINVNNQELWSKLDLKYTINLTESFEPNYLINFRKTFFGKYIVTIYIDKNNLDPASFTHELLHLYLKAQRVFICDDLEKILKKNLDMYYLFSTNLKDHIGNCLEHAKMLPLFIDIGFKTEDFLGDFNNAKMDLQRLMIIKNNYSSYNCYDKVSIDRFIGCFFAMKACNNVIFDYSFYKNEFRSLDPSLYSLLEKFWEGWINLDNLPKRKDYKELLNDFYLNLIKWKVGKRII